MTKCANCGEEVGPLFCGLCKMKEQDKFYPVPKDNLIPLLWWDNKNKEYVIGCTCLECAWNKDGQCKTKHKFLPKHLFHEFDNVNIIHQACG